MTCIANYMNELANECSEINEHLVEEAALPGNSLEFYKKFAEKFSTMSELFGNIHDEIQSWTPNPDIESQISDKADSCDLDSYAEKDDFETLQADVGDLESKNEELVERIGELEEKLMASDSYLKALDNFTQKLHEKLLNDLERTLVVKTGSTESPLPSTGRIYSVCNNNIDSQGRIH